VSSINPDSSGYDTAVYISSQKKEIKVTQN